MTPRVAVLDDTPALLLLYEVILGPRGYYVYTFDQETATPEAVAAVQPDLVIISAAYPIEKYDVPLLVALRSQPELACKPIIIASAVSQNILTPDAYVPFEPISLLMKPFGHDELLACVREALSAKASSGR